MKKMNIFFLIIILNISELHSKLNANEKRQLRKIENLLVSLKNNLPSINKKKVSKTKKGRKLNLNKITKEITKDIKKKFSKTFTDVDELTKVGVGASLLLAGTFKRLNKSSHVKLINDYNRENKAFFDLSEKYLNEQNQNIDSALEDLIDLEKRFIHHSSEICTELTEKKKAVILEKNLE